MFGGKESANERKDQMHPHLARDAIVRDVETTRYGRDYAGRRGKITHVDKDPRTGAASGYILRMEEGSSPEVSVISSKSKLALIAARGPPPPSLFRAQLL